MNYAVTPVFLSGNNIDRGDISTFVVPSEIEYPFTSNLKIKTKSVVFKDGFKLKINPFLEQIKDCAFTKNTAYFLTNLNTWDELIYDGFNTNVNALNNSTKILFDRLNNTGFFYAYFRDITNDNPFSCIFVDENFNIGVSQTQKTLIKVKKLENNKVNIFLYVVNSSTKITTEYLLGIDTSSYIHTPVLVIPADQTSTITTEFVLILDQSAVRISYEVYTFKNTTSFQESQLINDVFPSTETTSRFIGIKANQLKVNHVYRSTTKNIDTDFKFKNDLNIFKATTFALINPGYNPLSLGIPENKQNTWVGYYNEIFDKQHNQSVKPNPALTTSSVPINYLLVSSYKTQISSNKLFVNIVPLKTTYTTEQEGIKTDTVFIDGIPITNAPENLQPIQRSYTKLFSSNNSIENYANVHIGYSSSTREIKLPPDQSTFFHYPLQATKVSVNQANLIEAGAIPGATPFLSDKIFMKNAGYGTKSVWGHLTPPPGCLNGQFLCAWLSGSEASSLLGLENSIWVDRWYDAAQVTEVSAMEASTIALKSTLEGESIIDVPSTLVLNPGGWYYYDHIGNKSISTFIDSFNVGTTSARLQVKGTINTFEDFSTYNQFINIVNRKDNTIILSNPDNNLEDNYVLNLDNSNYATIQYTDSLYPTRDITFATWLQADKWESNPGYHIIDNGFRGGWSLRVFSGFYNPTVSVSEKQFGHGLNFSTDLRPYVDNILLSGISLLPDNVVVLNDLFTYAFDKTSKALCKFDYDGDLVDLIDISTYTQEITNSKLAVGPNDILHLHVNDVLIKTDTTFSSSITTNPLPYKNFVIDLEGNVIGGNFLDAAVDNNNNVWFVSSCPVSFFTEYTQPALDGPFFNGTEDADFLGRDLSAALIENGDLNFVFRCESKYTTSTFNVASAQPITIVDLTNNEITFASFFPNNAANGILAKFFQPVRIAIDEDDYLYITNDTQELMKLIIDIKSLNTGFIFRKPLLNTEFTTGVSLSGVNDYIQNQIIDRANNENRDELQFKYMEIVTTNNKWIDIKHKYNTSKIKDLCISKEYDYTINQLKKFIYYIDNNDSGFLYKFDTDGKYINSIRLFDGFESNEKVKIDTLRTDFNSVANSYDQYRKYFLPTLIEKKPIIELEFHTIKNKKITRSTLSTRQSTLANTEWHHIAFTYKYATGQIDLYLDGVVVDRAQVSPESEIYYRYTNNIGIGASVLKFNTLQDDLNTRLFLFQGKIDDIRMYDFVLTTGNIGRLILNKYKIHDMVWNIPVGTKNYIEEVKQYFKHKTPGSKSSMFDLYLIDSGITDRDLQIQIEDIIQQAIIRIAPAYTKLNNIVWQ